MGAETEILTHTVTVADATVSRFGFGVPLIAGNHNYWPERVRSFGQADELTVAPFNMPLTHPIYRAALKLKSQNPCPPTFKVGRMTGAIVHTVVLTPSEPATLLGGEVYSLAVDGQAVSVTSVPDASAAAIAALLVTAISALADVTATVVSGTVHSAGDTAGLPHSYESLTPNLTLLETTVLPASTPAADLAAIRAYDGDWYFLVLANGGQASVVDAAAWVETQRCLFIATTSDTAAASGGPTDDDVAAELALAGYHRTGVLYHERPVTQQPAAAWGGVMLPKLPGPASFANKGLAGVDKSALSASQRQALKSKHANYYVDIKGLGFTLNGWASSGRFFDVTVATDWFDVGIEDRIILLLRNNDVVPYTDKGIELVRAQVLGQIQEGIGLGIIDGAQDYLVTAPKVAAINPVDKAGRVLPDIRYSYVLSGAIQSVRIIGTVKV
jgi:hypothetical protein